MKSVKDILADPFNLDILKLCDGNYNITQIASKIDMTYKSIFLRLKEMERLGIIGIETPTKMNDGVKIKILEKHKEEIKKEVGGYNLAQEEINKILKTKKDSVIKVLKKLSKNRFIHEKYFIDDFYKDFSPSDLGVLEANLEIAGYVRNRVEITRKGKKLIDS